MSNAVVPLKPEAPNNEENMFVYDNRQANIQKSNQIEIINNKLGLSCAKLRPA